MENFFSRYRNETVLVAVLFIQVIALASQVRISERGNKESQPGGTRLIRVWASGAISPFQRLAVNSGSGLRSFWHNYVDLRRVRQENERLQQQINTMRLQDVRVHEDLEQARRLQVLLAFKERYINATVAAQVIGTSGTDLSRLVYIDRGSKDGIREGMAVITPDGIVGKVIRADSSTSQVLLINDQASGAGVLFERLRLKGILKGTSSGQIEVMSVMADEEIKPGDSIVTSGGDGVFPKGLPVGTVEEVFPDQERDPFLSIRVKPAVNLARLEEVLVITQMDRQTPEVDTSQGPLRAADLLAQRLPSVKKKLDAEAKDSTLPSGDPERGAIPAPAAVSSPTEAAGPNSATSNAAPKTGVQTRSSESRSPALPAAAPSGTAPGSAARLQAAPRTKTKTLPTRPKKPETNQPTKSSQPNEGSTPR